MTSLQEYDLEITPAQIFGGQGLFKIVVDSIEKQKSQTNTSTMNQHNEKQISCAQVTTNSWYENIKFYLMNGSVLGPRYDHFYDGYYTLFPHVHMCFSYFKGVF
jgi:hypothetical protein